MADGSPVEAGLPVEVTQPSVEKHGGGKWDWLKFWKKSSNQKVDAPIHGITPASPQELQNPVVTLPGEQDDKNARTIQSAKSVA